MRYLTLSADYMEPQLRDEATGSWDIPSSGLSNELVQEILKWNRDYQPVVPLAPANIQYGECNSQSVPSPLHR